MALPDNLATLDPYTQVYLVWSEAILGAPSVRQLVTREANIVRFSEGRGQDQERDNLATVDLPELVLRASNVSGNFNRASNLADVERDYATLITTDVGKITDKLFPLEWAITCIYTNLNFRQQLLELTWNGDTFVKSVQFMGADSGSSDPLNNRGQKGWASVWRMRVKMCFSQSAIKLFEQTGSVA